MCLTESRVFWPVVQEAAAYVGFRAGVLSLLVHCLLLLPLFGRFKFVPDFLI